MTWVNVESEEELQRILDSLTVRLVRIKNNMDLQEFGLELADAFGIFVRENYRSVLEQEEITSLYEHTRVTDYYNFYLQAVAQISAGKKI